MPRSILSGVLSALRRTEAPVSAGSPSLAAHDNHQEPRRTATGKYLLTGALHGAVVWGAYAVVEQALCLATPMVWGFEAMPTPTYWRVIGVLMLSFVLLGCALGALCGLALKILDDRGAGAREASFALRFRRAAVVTLALACALNWPFVRPFNRIELFCLAVSVLLAVVLVLSERFDAWNDRVGFLANPWLATLLIFGAGWVGRQALFYSVPLVRGAGVVATVVLVGSVGMVASFAWKRWGLRADSFYPARAAVILAVVGAVVLVSGSPAIRWGAPPLPPLQSRAAPGHPNIIMVTMDTVRADHLPLYGYPRDTTPFLRELAKGATVYEHAIATSNLTLTTHASLFTGLYGSWHGAHLAPPDLPGGPPLSKRHLTVAQILASNGYRTMSVVANNSYLGHHYGVLRGFQASPVLAPAVAVDRQTLRLHLGRLVDALMSSDELSLNYSRAEEVTQAAIALVAKAKAEGGPFFLFINYMDAHTPYVPPAPFNTSFPGRDRDLHFREYRAMRFQVMGGDRGASPRELKHFVSQYDGGIRYLDSQLARLVSRLKDLGLFQDTMIVITSDHGEEFAEHDLVGHGVSVYQNEVHVPLLIKYPRQEEARTVATLVSQVDVMPTVLSAVGLPAPPQVQGEPLQDLQTDSSRFVMSEAFPNANIGPRFVKFLKTDRAVFSGDMKYIAAGTGGPEFYDLSHDPNETTNLYRAGDAGAIALSRHLGEWLRGVPTGANEKLDEETLRRLRSLGYVQ